MRHLVYISEKWGMLEWSTAKLGFVANQGRLSPSGSYRH
jgi:hypothetical protein